VRYLFLEGHQLDGVFKDSSSQLQMMIMEPTEVISCVSQFHSGTVQTGGVQCTVHILQVVRDPFPALEVVVPLVPALASELTVRVCLTVKNPS